MHHLISDGGLVSTAMWGDELAVKLTVKERGIDFCIFSLPALSTSRWWKRKKARDSTSKKVRTGKQTGREKKGGKNVLG